VDTSCSNRNTESKTLFLLYLELLPPPLETEKINTIKQHGTKKV
jgi:hypothetical protein